MLKVTAYFLYSARLPTSLICGHNVLCKPTVLTYSFFCFNLKISIKNKKTVKVMMMRGRMRMRKSHTS